MGNGTYPGQVLSGATFTPNDAWLLNADKAEYKSVALDPAARDATGTPTTTLRSGLVMGKVTVGGKWKEYDDTDADGTEVARAILNHPIVLLDPFGTAIVAPVHGGVVIAGRVRASALYGYDAAAKVDMAARFIFEADYE